VPDEVRTHEVPRVRWQLCRRRHAGMRVLRRRESVCHSLRCRWMLPGRSVPDEVRTHEVSHVRWQLCRRRHGQLPVLRWREFVCRPNDLHCGRRMLPERALPYALGPLEMRGAGRQLRRGWYTRLCMLRRPKRKLRRMHRRHVRGRDMRHPHRNDHTDRHAADGAGAFAS